MAVFSLGLGFLLNSLCSVGERQFLYGGFESKPEHGWLVPQVSTCPQRRSRGRGWCLFRLDYVVPLLGDGEAELPEQGTLSGVQGTPQKPVQIKRER